MKYQITVSFECATEDLAILAFQNAIEKIAWADGANFRQAQLLKIDRNAPVIVDPVQTLGPEDFSNWTGQRKVNEEVYRYEILIADGGRDLNTRILDRLYRTRCSKSQSWNDAVIAALNSIEEVNS